MNYSFHNSCYSTPQQAYIAMASSCPVATSDGLTVSCTPNETGYEYTRFDGVNSFTYQVTPTLIDCDIDVEQAIELTGLLTLLLIAAFTIQILKRPIR